MKPDYRIGDVVITLKGDQDCDDQDKERHAAPGERGRIERILPSAQMGEPYYSVIFEPSGVWVFLTAAELSDPAQYTIEWKEHAA
jgi:hypothetical protein